MINNLKTAIARVANRVTSASQDEAVIFVQKGLDKFLPMLKAKAFPDKGSDSGYIIDVKGAKKKLFFVLHLNEKDGVYVDQFDLPDNLEIELILPPELPMINGKQKTNKITKFFDKAIDEIEISKNRMEDYLTYVLGMKDFMLYLENAKPKGR